MERAVILAPGKRVVPQDLPQEVRSRSRQRASQTFDLEQQERALIQQALERFGGSRRQAAEALRISPVTLWRKIKRYKLEA
jgi:DNA-binding NtrC family response regulator